MFSKTKIRPFTKNLYDDMPNGYQETIEKGMSTVRYFSRNMSYGKGSKEERINRLRQEIGEADAIVIGAGAGLSTSAGLTYSGERFEKYFFDFAKRFGIRDMYSGGFYPFPDNETRWAWWARHIYFNRYIDAPKPVYTELLKLVSDKDYFVITTNVDHQFQRAGFDKKRLFYTQGDYGLFQSVKPAIQKTYDNEEWVAAIITHATMYVGWPKGWAVFRLAKEVWNEEMPELTEKDRYQNSICFPIGDPNPYGEFFVGQSYLAPVSMEQVPVFNVTFEPGCRNNWHIHHAKSCGGQMLICIGGRGYYQEWGKEAVEMTPGKVINIPAEVKHWHGAAPDSWFSHLAIEVAGEEASNEWLEAVSDEDYRKLS